MGPTRRVGFQSTKRQQADGRATGGLASRMPRPRAGSLQTRPFLFLRSCRSLPPSFDWKGSRKTQTRKEWQFEKLDSFSSFNLFANQPNFQFATKYSCVISVARKEANAGRRPGVVDPDEVAIFLTPSANEQGHPSTTQQWYGCRDRVFSHLTELTMRGRVEPV